MSVFPLKTIFDQRTARCLQDVAGLDTNNPRPKTTSTMARGINSKKYAPISPYRNVSMQSNNSDSVLSNRSTLSDNLYENVNVDKINKLMYCLGIIVEDTIDQMHILSSGKKFDKYLQKFQMSLEERFANMLQEDPIYDIESGDLYNVAFSKKKLNKNLDDCAIYKEFLLIIKNELRIEKSYSSVRDIMNTIVCRKEAEENLLKEEATNFTKMKDLKLMLINHSRDYQLRMQAVNEMLASSEDRTQELLFENLLRVKYIKIWEKARQEQNTLSCRKSEKELEDIIAKYQSEIEKEIRIHTEIETFVSENLIDLQSGIKYWIARYDKEMESTNIQIQIMRDRKDDQEKGHQKLKDIFALHKKQMKDFIAYKEQKKLAEELRERQTKSAIKIQAWWRGNMVRHHLGPFNPKKKGKKGKDKNKKKK